MLIFFFQELLREIVSQSNFVRSCIRSSEESTRQQSSEQEAGDTTSTSPCSSSRKADASIRGLEKRFHLLYLRAIEVQCLFEALLGGNKSPVSH